MQLQYEEILNFYGFTASQKQMQKLQIENEIVKLKAQLRFLQDQLYSNDTDGMITIGNYNCVNILYKDNTYRRFDGNHVYWEKQVIGKSGEILWEELDKETEIMLENEYYHLTTS